MAADAQIMNNPSAKEVVIRQYGLLDPINWDDDCDQELATMDIFWNRLVEIHELYIAKYYAMILKDHDLNEAKLKFETLNAASSVSVEAKEAKRKLAILQAEIQKKLAVPLKHLEEQRREEVKVARQQSGLWWGNYNAVVRAFETGRRTAVRAGHSMRKRTGSGSGRFTNQLIGGASVERLFDGSLSQIYIRPPAPAAWEDGPRGYRRRLQRTTLTATIFVRDGERRNVTWPMVMHRRIPQDCIVKEVVISRRMIAGRAEWFATFVCSRSINQLVTSPRVPAPTAVDVGWRVVPEGLRVATVLHPKAEPYFVVLDRTLVESFAFVRDLKRSLDQSAIEGIAILERHHPADLTDSLQTAMRSSRVELLDSHAPFIAMIPNGSPDAKLDNHEEIFNWRTRHRRKAHWLINHQKKIIAQRNYLYQNAAAAISRSASYVLISDLNLGRMVRSRSTPNSEMFFPRQAKYYQSIAAISELIRWIGIQCNKSGVTVEKRQLRSPLPCPECGSMNRTTRADALIQTCDACGASWDQDVAACHLLLQNYAAKLEN